MSTSDQQPLHKKDHAFTDPPPKKKGFTGYDCYKALVTLFAIFFLILGIILLGVGAWVESIRSDYETINDALLSPSILGILVGSLMIITAFCGLIGAVRENLVLLKIFLAAVIIVFLVQVIIGILAFVYRQKTEKLVADQLLFGIEHYHEDDGVKHAVDYIQRKFECCGAASPSDWEQNEALACGSNYTVACSVPVSCCMQAKYDREGETCGNGIRKSSSQNSALMRRGINTKGCRWPFLAWLAQHLDVIGALALAFAIPQILGIFLVFTFIQKVEDRKYLFKYRKRAYDTS